MPKLIVKSFDEIKEYKITGARLVTPLYKAKLKERQVHSPSTALLVAKNETNGFQFVLSHPLIECDQMGDITVYTDKKFSDIILNSEHLINSRDYKINKLELKTLQDKINLGATIDEVWMYEDFKNKVEIGKILRKNKFYVVLGGVK